MYASPCHTGPIRSLERVGPVIMGRPHRPELQEEPTESFCPTDPAAAEECACVTLLAYNRDDLPHVRGVGEYVQRHISRSEFVVIETSGHCLHTSEPEAVIQAMRDFLP